MVANGSEERRLIGGEEAADLIPERCGEWEEWLILRERSATADGEEERQVRRSGRWRRRDGMDVRRCETKR